MLETVKNLTTEYDMLPRGARVLCAVSGGADSICLLHLLHSLSAEGGFTVAAAHYHHGMRGEVADADAAFVETFCKERNIPCVVERGDVYGEAQRLEDGDLVSFDGVCARLVDLTEDRYLEVHEFHCHDCIIEVSFFEQSVLDIFGKLPPGHPSDIDLSKDREVDISIVVHYISHKSLLISSINNF